MDTEQKVKAVTDLVGALFETIVTFAQGQDVSTPDWVEVTFESLAVIVGLMVGGARSPFREELLQVICNGAREYFPAAEKMRQEYMEARHGG